MGLTVCGFNSVKPLRFKLIDFGASKDFAATVATRGTRIGTQGYQWVKQWPTHLQQPISDHLKQVLDK